MRRIASVFVLLAAGGMAAELPVTQVILYKNGIGYFVRSGELKAGESGRLSFKAGEMNDVLKSLTVTGRDGARIAGLRYESSEPLDRKLAVFPFKLGEQAPLWVLLDQWRGSRIELRTGAESVSGAVLSAREVPGTERTPSHGEAALLADSGELRTVDLTGITAIVLGDAVLQGQLKDYLATVAGGRSRDQRTVVIDSADTNARRITASYVVPAPVWKSSYRLVFSDAAEPTLEGWAIVDNTSDTDWTNVRLALVSGRPVSFVSRLYEPRYVDRPAAELAEDRPVAPETYAGAIGGVGSMLMAAPAPPPPMREPLSPQGKFAAKARETAAVDAIAPVTSSLGPTAEASERGELFEYAFATPVTVRSGESAMLPFVQQTVAARKLLVYSTAGSEHPRNAAEITNTSGKTLDGGPVTVFDGNAYAGEALVETVKAGDKRLVSYAVDLGTRVTTKLDSRRDFVRELHARRGVLTVRSAVQETTTYTVRNVDRKEKTLIVEHAIRPEYKLVNAKPRETTASAYRFEVKLAPEASDRLPVVEERVYDQTIALGNATPDMLFSYVQNKALDEAARKQLEGIARQKGLIATNDGAIRRAEEQAGEIARDQDRLRQNIMALQQVAGQQEQVQNYARQLAANEARIAALRDSQSELRNKKTALENELNRLIETIGF